MRVISGSAKGTRLYAPSGLNVRPVLDRIKESVFSLLSDVVCGARVLDLFAGSGALGIEALSRGADNAIFLEKNPVALEAVKSNLKRTHLEEKGRVLRANLPEGLRKVKGRFDLIFLDPPFRIEKSVLSKIFLTIERKKLLEEGGLLVFRHSPRLSFSPTEEIWGLVCRKDYGDSIVSFYEFKG